jgi:hypothetical protein
MLFLTVNIYSSPGQYEKGRNGSYEWHDRGQVRYMSLFYATHRLKKMKEIIENCSLLPSEYTEWQRPLSGVHSIMMVKSAQPGEGGGCTPSPFTPSTITSKVVV